MSNDVTQPDKSIFESKQATNCSSHSDIHKCISLSRLAAILKYYGQLNITDNHKHQETFINFIDNVYPDFFNDYIHFVKMHSHQIEDILNDFVNNQGFIKCKMGNCIITSRHHTEHNQNNNKENSNIALYKQTMDSLHFYIFHAFDAGLRIPKTVSSIDNNEDTKSENEYYDASFAKIKKILSEKNKNTESFERFGSNNNAKFNIKTEFDESTKDHITVTFTESLQSHLKTDDIDTKIINNLRKFLKTEEYDTDAITMDFDGENGNISFHIKNEECIKSIISFLSFVKMSSSSFNIGLRFYYWKFYRNIDELPPKECRVGRIKHHSGYKIKQLFVQKKYKSFGEEIKNYKYLHIDEYNELILKKSEIYLKSALVKKMKSKLGVSTPLHYGIKRGTPLKLNNLIALILYTDFTQLSADFSATFRAIHPAETVSSIKKRNSKYFWWSKILRETVELYGDRAKEEGNDKDIDTAFYTGMSFVMSIPTFLIRLCSPISTSVQLEVAMKFAKDQGIILQLNVDKVIDGAPARVRAFDCSWISRYKEEDERYEL